MTFISAPWVGAAAARIGEQEALGAAVDRTGVLVVEDLVAAAVVAARALVVATAVMVAAKALVEGKAVAALLAWAKAATVVA